MSLGDSSDSSSSDGPRDTPLCIICDQAAVGLGPFSRMHLCPQHLSVDVADARKLKEEVAEELRVFSQGGAGDVATAGRELCRMMQEQLQEMERSFDTMQRRLDGFRAGLTGLITARLETARVWLRDLEDVESYRQEVAMSEASGNMAEVVHLTLSMQVSLPDLQADFERAQKLSVESDGVELQLRRLRQLERLVDSAADADESGSSRNAAITAKPDVKDAAETSDASMFDQIVFSHKVKLDGIVAWLAVCSDTSGFVGDRSGRVVPADSAGEGSVALPQPCIFASFLIHSNKDHLQVLSVDGSQRLRCHCDVNWKKDINGLHCDRQLLFIAQDDAVTVTDLSGRAVRRIRPREGFGSIRGIGGNEASLFVCSGNKIAAFSKATDQMETVITLSQLPDADLRNLLIHDNCILVTDWKHRQVHRVRIDTQQLVASHPTQRAGLGQFARPCGVAVDRRGRLFVSENWSCSVRAVAADDGSLLWTLGVPGESGSGDDRLCCPWGLSVVTGGPREQLVVADCANMRLVVLNIV